MAKIDYDDIEMSLYQVRVIAVNDNYDSDNYDGSTGGINDKNKIIVDPEEAKSDYQWRGQYRNCMEYR